MVTTTATASLFPISSPSPQPDSGAKNSGKHGGGLGSVDVCKIKSKSSSNGLQVKTNAQAPSKVNGTRIGVMDGLKADDGLTSSAPRTFINQLPDWSMLLAAITTIFLAAEKQWMMLDWKTKRPDMLADLDPFGFGRIVEDGLVFRQNFSIRSYEIGADRTASVETLMNHLQETALNHVKNAGLLGEGFGSTPEMCKKNLFWVVTKMQVLVDRYPTWGDVVQVDTWVAASGKNCMRRDWLIRDCKTGEILIRGRWEVKCNDAGIRMFKANVGITVDEWLRSADESDERNLTVWEDMPDGDPTSWSPFRIQISEFVGGGLAIGISFPHLLADLTSAVLFYKSWTDAERGDPTGHHPPILTLPPLHNRPPPTSTDHTSTTIKYLQRNSKLSPNILRPKMATSSFKFSNTMIKQGLSKVADKCPNATPFDYLTALFWLQIMKLKTLMPDSATHSISLCVDARNLLDVPIPMKFFGNALTLSQLHVQHEVLMGDNGLAEALRLVHDHVNGIKKDDIHSMIDWLESDLEAKNVVYPKAVQMYGPELTCVNLEHLMDPKDEFESLVYESKFRNNEKPVHVSYHVGKAEGAGLIIVAPSHEGGLARTVTVTLPAEEVVKLCEDPVIMGMQPTMILSGRG